MDYSRTSYRCARANDPNALHVSDRYVEDGSYVRLKAVTLGYQF